MSSDTLPLKMIIAMLQDNPSSSKKRKEEESSETEDDSDDEIQVVEPASGWAYVGSHNFTPSAWGTLSGSSFNPILNVRLLCPIAVHRFIFRDRSLIMRSAWYFYWKMKKTQIVLHVFNDRPRSIHPRTSHGWVTRRWDRWSLTVVLFFRYRKNPSIIKRLNKCYSVRRNVPKASYGDRDSCI